MSGNFIHSSLHIQSYARQLNILTNRTRVLIHRLPKNLILIKLSSCSNYIYLPHIDSKQEIWSNKFI
jgi:hypothetical protein